MNKENSFSEISDSEGLIKNLENKVKNLQNTKNKKVNYIYHYTKLDAVINILKSKKWHLNSPYNMNDGLELKNSFSSKSSNIFFSSFMLDSTESIAMWSMYAQPWSNGVMIKIPVEKFKKWLKTGCRIEIVENSIDITNLSTVKSYAIAYSMEDVSSEELVCGEQHNSKLKRARHKPELFGYIKDYAWHYENEIRLRVDVTETNLILNNKIAICIPDEVLNSIEIVTGPRFNKDSLTRIKKEYDSNFDNKRISQSLFTNLLKWVYCDSCK